MKLVLALKAGGKTNKKVPNPVLACCMQLTHVAPVEIWRTATTIFFKSWIKQAKLEHPLDSQELAKCHASTAPLFQYTGSSKKL